jgi:hypothetical protein
LAPTAVPTLGADVWNTAVGPPATGVELRSSAMSDSGQYAIAAANIGQVWTSTNYG